MLQTVRSGKEDDKMGSFARFPCFLPKLWSLNIFAILCADLSKIFKYIKAIYLYASKMSRCALSENSEINHKINHKIF